MLNTSDTGGPPWIRKSAPGNSVLLASVCLDRSRVLRACQASASTTKSHALGRHSPPVSLPPLSTTACRFLPANQSFQVSYLSSQSPHLFSYRSISSSLFLFLQFPGWSEARRRFNIAPAWQRGGSDFWIAAECRVFTHSVAGESWLEDKLMKDRWIRCGFLVMED